MLKTLGRVVVVIAAFLGGACLTLAQEPPVTQAPPPIDFPEWKLVARTDRQIEYSLQFPSAYATKYPENNVVPVRVILPGQAARPVPCVIALHYWGATDQRVERALAGELTRHGVGAILMTLPYHLSRTPAGMKSGEMALQPDPAALIANMTQSIWDVRRTVDWIQTQPELDHTRIGIAGTSLGAVVATLAYAVEPRLTNAAFVLGGVDLAGLIWGSSRTVRERDELRGRGFTESKLRTALEPIEPLRYLSRRITGESFVVAARYDTVIPKGSTDALIAALPNPKVLWVDTGHYGGFFVERRLLREVGAFFGAVFNGRDYAPPSRIYAPTIRLGAMWASATNFDLVAGLDLLRFDRRGEGFASLLVSPRGPRLFVGRKIQSNVSVGFVASRAKIGFGIFWSTVL